MIQFVIFLGNGVSLFEKSCTAFIWGMNTVSTISFLRTLQLLDYKIYTYNYNAIVIQRKQNKNYIIFMAIYCQIPTIWILNKSHGYLEHQLTLLRIISKNSVIHKRGIYWSKTLYMGHHSMSIQRRCVGDLLRFHSSCLCTLFNHFISILV